MAGLNHSFVLDLTYQENRNNFLIMIDSLINDQAKKVKILISDLWDEYTIKSYENLIQALSLKNEMKNIKESLSCRDKEHYLENVIKNARGELQLKRIKETKQLEIRKIKLMGDTFVFVDPASEDNGLCYFSLFSSPGGKLRPVFSFTKRDDNYIFNIYHNFVTMGWNSMSEPVWPLDEH